MGVYHESQFSSYTKASTCKTCGGVNTCFNGCTGEPKLYIPVESKYNPCSRCGSSECSGDCPWCLGTHRECAKWVRGRSDYCKKCKEFQDFKARNDRDFESLMSRLDKNICCRCLRPKRNPSDTYCCGSYCDYKPRSNRRNLADATEDTTSPSERVLQNRRLADGDRTSPLSPPSCGRSRRPSECSELIGRCRD